MTVSAEDVRNGYRFILGRMPESERVVEIHCDCADVEHLRRALLASREFREAGLLRAPEGVSGLDAARGGGDPAR